MKKELETLGKVVEMLEAKGESLDCFYAVTLYPDSVMLQGNQSKIVGAMNALGAELTYAFGEADVILDYSVVVDDIKVTVTATSVTEMPDLTSIEHDFKGNIDTNAAAQ